MGARAFVKELINKSPNNNITNEYVEGYINLFFEEYSSSPIQWDVILWLNNIFIEFNEIEISPNVFLRRPIKEQLADYRPKPQNEDDFERITGRRLPVGAILSFSIELGRVPYISAWPDEVSRLIEQWLSLLRLFMPSSVTLVNQTVSPKSILKSSFSETVNSITDNAWKGKIDYSQTSSYKLFLKKDDKIQLEKFIFKMQPLLDDISDGSYLSGDEYELAYHRYNDALIKTDVNAYKIISSITSIESVLKEGQNTKTSKVKKRLCLILKAFGYDYAESMLLMRKAYALRNALVHGSRPLDSDGDLLKFAKKYTYEILNYNRICLLLFLQLKPFLNCQGLLELIDDSIKKSEVNSSLQTLIAENVNIPNVNC